MQYAVSEYFDKKSYIEIEDFHVEVSSNLK